MIVKQRYEGIIVQRNKEGLSRYAWFAIFDTYDGPGSPIGSGNTPGEAVDDLFDIAEIIP